VIDPTDRAAIDFGVQKLWELCQRLLQAGLSAQQIVMALGVLLGKSVAEGDAALSAQIRADFSAGYDLASETKETVH
jgi:hypothetical protein